MLGAVRRRSPGNTRNRNFVRRQLNGIGADTATSQRIDTLRQAFAGDLPTVVENELSDLRRLNLGGRELVLRLEMLQERYRLNPAAQSASTNCLGVDARHLFGRPACEIGTMSIRITAWWQNNWKYADAVKGGATMDHRGVEA